MMLFYLLYLGIFLTLSIGYTKKKKKKAMPFYAAENIQMLISSNFYI